MDPTTVQDTQVYLEVILLLTILSDSNFLIQLAKNKFQT